MIQRQVFRLRFFIKTNPTDTETEILNPSNPTMVYINDWDKRCFKLFRNVIKYGDQVLVRDPETYKLLWVDPAKIEKIVVNEGKGKKPEAYFIRDLDLNLQNLNLTTMSPIQYTAPNSILPSGNMSSGDAQHKGMTTAISTPKQVDPKWK